MLLVVPPLAQVAIPIRVKLGPLSMTRAHFVVPDILGYVRFRPDVGAETLGISIHVGAFKHLTVNGDVTAWPVHEVVLEPDLPQIAVLGNHDASSFFDVSSSFTPLSVIDSTVFLHLRWPHFT